MAARDPYLLLAQATGFIDYLPAYGAEEPLDLLLELAGDGTQKPLKAAGALVNVAHLEAQSRFVTARMPLSVLAQLEAQGAIAAAELAQPLRHQRTMWPAQPAAESVAQLPPLEVQRSAGEGSFARTFSCATTGICILDVSISRRGRARQPSAPSTTSRSSSTATTRSVAIRRFRLSSPGV